MITFNLLSTEIQDISGSLEAEGLLVGRCEVSRIVQVSGITNESFRNNVQALKRYFQSTKRSGGGPVDTVLLQTGVAIITFEDHNGTDPSFSIVHKPILYYHFSRFSDPYSSGERALKTWTRCESGSC